MAQEHVEEWSRLRAEARTALSPGYALLRLSTFPSFENSVSFVADFRGRLTRLEWRRDLDLEKFDSPVELLRHPRRLWPTIETAVTATGKPIVDEWITRFAKIAIPAAHADRAIFIDGVEFELELGGQQGACFYWNSGGPPAWAGLVAEFDRLWEEIAALPFSDASN
jgi:hypothetical protein